MRTATRLRLTRALTAGAVALGVAVRSLPGALGVLLVAYGMGLAWRPLGFIALGAAFLLIDRRVP